MGLPEVPVSISGFPEQFLTLWGAEVELELCKAFANLAQLEHSSSTGHEIFMMITWQPPTASNNPMKAPKETLRLDRMEHGSDSKRYVGIKATESGG